jgi:2-polyprenyl-3-methyl-5-hydroxy-6-metoxy-1,4-benzoquinol methylase
MRCGDIFNRDGISMSSSLAPEVREHYHDHVRADVIPHVPKHGGTLLDLGGGIGATAARLKALGHADRVGVVDLVDPPADALDRDFSYAGNLEDPALLDRIIAEQGPFSTILCLDILEHLVDPWRVVARLHAGLAPGGVIVASIPNVRHYTALAPLLFRNRWALSDAGILDRTHLRFFVRDSAIELMTSSGLKLEEIVPKAGGGGKVRAFRKLTLGMLNSFTDLQYIVRVCREN